MIARFIAAICGHRAHVGGVTYRRGPDGRLYGFMDPKPKEKS